MGINIGQINKALLDSLKQNDRMMKDVDALVKEKGDDKKLADFAKEMQKLQKSQADIAKKLVKAIEESDKKKK